MNKKSNRRSTRNGQGTLIYFIVGFLMIDILFGIIIYTLYAIKKQRNENARNHSIEQTASTASGDNTIVQTESNGVATENEQPSSLTDAPDVTTAPPAVSIGLTTTVTVVASVPDTLTEMGYGTIKLKSDKYLNIRNSPSTSAAKVGLIPNGTSTKIWDFGQDDWYYIEYSGIKGYISSQYVQFGSETTAAATTEKIVNVYLTEVGYAEVNMKSDKYLNIRKEPSISSDIVGQIPNHARVFLWDAGERDWYYVDYGKSQGYVSADYVVIEKETTVQTTALQTTTETTTVTTTVTTTQATTITTETEFPTTEEKIPAISGTIKKEQPMIDYGGDIGYAPADGYDFTLIVSGDFDYYDAEIYVCDLSGEMYYDRTETSQASELYLTAGSTISYVTVLLTPYYENGTVGETIVCEG